MDDDVEVVTESDVEVPVDVGAGGGVGVAGGVEPSAEPVSVTVNDVGEAPPAPPATAVEPAAKADGPKMYAYWILIMSPILIPENINATPIV